MKVVVCSRNAAAYLLRKDPSVSHVISIRDPEEPACPDIVDSGRSILELLFHNIEVIKEHMVAPCAGDMGRVFEFAGGLANNHGSMVVHCHGGMNRSPAVAIAVVALWSSRFELLGSMREFHDENPNIDPNRRIIEAADRLLRLQGLLLDVVETFWPRPHKKAV
jgi:predicted protein tyrosine phosphatase